SELLGVPNAEIIEVVFDDERASGYERDNDTSRVKPIEFVRSDGAWYIDLVATLRARGDHFVNERLPEKKQVTVRQDTPETALTTYHEALAGRDWLAASQVTTAESQTAMLGTACFWFCYASDPDADAVVKKYGGTSCSGVCEFGQGSKIKDRIN